MKNQIEMGAYVPREQEEVISNPMNGEIREIDGELKVIAIGKMINGDFAFADLEEVMDAGDAIANEEGYFGIGCVEVADDCLPDVLYGINGMVYINKSNPNVTVFDEPIPLNLSDLI